MTQTTLFDISSVTTPSRAANPRQTVIDAALQKAHEEWKRRYEDFILEFAANRTEPFTAEDVREAYLATPGLPMTDAQQASGGIFQRLTRERRLQKAGHIRSRKFGNFLQGYVKW